MGMDWGGIIAGALGGGAQAVQGIAQNYQDQDARANLAKVQSDLEEQKQMRIMQAQQDMTFAGQAKERDRRSAYMTSGATLQQARDAANKAGDMEAAAQFDRQIDSGTKQIAPYASLVDSSGKELYHNDGADKTKAMIDRAQAKSGSKADKMPEAAKIELTGLERQEQGIYTQINKLTADPLADKTAVAALQAQAEKVSLRKDRLLAANGVKDGVEDAQIAIDTMDPAELPAAAARAAQIGGRYGAQFLHALDASGKMPKPKPAAQAEAPAAPAKSGGLLSGLMGGDDRPHKDFMGPGWSFKGKTYKTKEEAYKAAGIPIEAPAVTNGTGNPDLLGLPL